MLSLPLISCLNFCRRPILANHSGSTGNLILTTLAFRHSLVDMMTTRNSCSFSIKSYVSDGRRCCRRKKRPASCTDRKQSVLLSPWYVNFLCPGFTRDLTHELSSSNHFGMFSLFRMNLEKVEELTNILVERGYIAEPWSL